MCKGTEGRKDGRTERGRAFRPFRLSVLPSFRLPPPATPPAQDTALERRRQRLEEIRRERDRLQEQQQRLQGQVHDVNDELSTLERQRECSPRIASEIQRPRR